MDIGSIIKKLRRERDMTQEQLAEFVGVTPSAVSQWETGRVLPDLSLLPSLAGLFGVSADVLLGIDVADKQKQIDEIYKEAWDVGCTGDHRRDIGIIKAGLAKFPDSYKLMGFFADEIYMYNDMTDESEREENKKRALGYLEKILADCTDMTVRNGALSTACLWYPKLGRLDEAVALAETTDGAWSKNDLLSHIYTGTKLYETVRDDAIGNLTQAAGYNMGMMWDGKNDDGSDIYTDEEKLEINRKRMAVFELLFEDGDYLFHAQYVEIACMNCARLCLKLGRTDEAESYVDKAARFAVMFDTYDPEAAHTSLLARGSVGGGVWWHDSHNRSHDLLNDLSGADFDGIRDKIKGAVEALTAVAK